jgi:alkylated DNA nucleotide flippase Atl1/2'-5' RNA ligase
MVLHLLPFLRLIPKGFVTTYGDLAFFFGVPHYTRQIGQILRANQERDRYPCYKVVGQNGDLIGYSGGIAEKEQRLRHDGITVRNGKVVDMEKRRWKPNIHSFFLAFPLDEQYHTLFSKACNQVKSLLPSSSILRFQHVKTPHSTLYFYGNLSLEDEQVVVNRLQQWEHHTIGIHPFSMRFQHLHFFGRPHRVAFFSCRDGKKQARLFQHHMVQFLQIKEHHPYIPHLTFFRITDTQQFSLWKDIIVRTVDHYSFTIESTRIRWYAAVEDQHQIPLIDFSLSYNYT